MNTETPTTHTDHITQQQGGCGAGCFDDAVAEYRAAEAVPAPLDKSKVRVQ